MSIVTSTTDSAARLTAHLLGRLPLASAWRLQLKLAGDLAERGEPHGMLLLAEHPPSVTLGRAGSRAHIRMSPEELASRRLNVKYATRGGACVAHGPGQLAIYPVIPLDAFGWSAGEFCARLQSGIQDALALINVIAHPRPGRFGLWGRTGHLLFVGAAVRRSVTWHGAFLNVAPEMGIYRRLITDPVDQSPAGSLAQERQGRADMSAIRGAVVAALAAAFDCAHYNLHTGHPLLRTAPAEHKANRRRAS